MKKAVAFVFSTMIAFGASDSFADSHKAPLTDLAKTKISAWLKNPAVVSAVKAQNAKNASRSQDQVIKLDKQWRAETKAGSGPLIDSVLANPLSKYL